MSKKILTVGFELASKDTEHATFRSKMSLLDWDIVLFKPQIGEFYSGSGSPFQGKPNLSDSMSFSLKECCEHWRREIKQAFETGKMVVVYLPALQEVYVDSGRREYSGTGKNQRTTRIVEPYSNYKSIPSNLSPVPTSGSSMKLVDRGAEVLAPYWKEFESLSKYEVLLTHENITPCITTRTGNKAVGALFRNMASSGTLLFLPDIDFDADEFSAIKNGAIVWTKAAQQFAGRFVSSIVSLDKALRSDLEVTPEPAWASDNRFVLASEQKLRVNLLEAEKQVEEAQRHKESISTPCETRVRFELFFTRKGNLSRRQLSVHFEHLGSKPSHLKNLIPNLTSSLNVMRGAL